MYLIHFFPLGGKNVISVVKLPFGIVPLSALENEKEQCGL